MKTKLEIKPSEYRRLSDEELMRRYAELNEYPAINYIFERYGHIIFGICLKKTRDVNAARTTMEAMMLQLPDAFKKSKAENFKSWLFAFVTDNNQTTAKEGSKRLVDATEGNIAKQILPQAHEAAATNLNRDQKLCMELFYNCNQNYEAVAKTTGYSVPKVKSLLHTGSINIAPDTLRTHHTY